MLAKLDGNAPLEEDANAALLFNQQKQQGDAGKVNDQKSATESNDQNGVTDSAANNSAPAPSNPIGKLQEFCMQEGLPSPVYNLEVHNILFY